MILRDYLYLDTKRLEDYMSNLDPGDLKQLKETITKDATDGEPPSPALGEPNESDPSNTKEKRETVLSVSTKHSFNRLYDKLSEGNLVDLDEKDLKIRRGQAVEVTREFTPSPITQMIESLIELMRMMQAFDAPELQDPDAQQAIAFMSVFFSEEEMKNKGLPILSTDDGAGYSIVFTAERQYILRDPDEMFGEMTLVGKVNKVIPEDSEIDLFDLLKVLPRNMRRGDAGTQIKEAIIELFTSWPQELGHSIDRSALSLKGPAVIIDPLAVFT